MSIIALNVSNWNEERKQRDQFFNILERIYQTAREAEDGVRWNMYLLQRQVELIDRLLDDPDSMPDEDL